MKRPAISQIPPDGFPAPASDPDARSAPATDWADEAQRTAETAVAALAEPQRLFAEFRRKLALGETLARAFQKLAEALRFSGRITLTFHQGRLTKTVLEEAYFRGRPVT
jgi:predicted TIM-barrel fold metal-dependent hydrolase